MKREGLGRRVKGSGSIYTRKGGTVVGQYEIDTLEGKKRKYIRDRILWSSQVQNY